MIRLRRPAPPAVLVRKAPAATAALRAAWDRGETPQVDAGVYGHPDVKAKLREAQHDKCAYCETKDARSHGAVEHFRPKNGWRQRAGESLQRPGYFWLAYDWENLLFACPMCNDAGHKGNRFPLANPRARATPAQPDHRGERPLLLNVYESRTDPERHIAWSAHVPRPEGKSRRGRETIGVFGLDRDRLLIDRRRDLLRFATLIVERAEREAPGSAERFALRGVLSECLDDSAEYAAMMRANLGDRIRAL